MKILSKRLAEEQERTPEGSSASNLLGAPTGGEPTALFCQHVDSDIRALFVSSAFKKMTVEYQRLRGAA
jgi:hypothetical protein